MHNRAMGMLRSNTSRAIAAVVVGCIVVTFAMGYAHALQVQESYERTMLSAFPSGQRAFAYGELHFDAQNPSAYDMNTAEAFFEEALRLDPSLPYVHHELARIYFIHGDFADAMIQINTQIALHATSTPNSYYVRALIEGYMGDYADSINDYQRFLQFDPNNWAGMNDYAWVLLKAKKYNEALAVTGGALQKYPTNPWLLNSNAIALYETGHADLALYQERKVVTLAASLTPSDWLHAYPGNDPKIAYTGIAAFQQAAQDNVHMMELALGK